MFRSPIDWAIARLAKTVAATTKLFILMSVIRVRI